MDQWKAVKAQGHIDARPQPDSNVQQHVLVCPKRVRVVCGGEVLADSAKVLLLRERGHLPVYSVPREDVRMAPLQPSEHRTRCPYRGEASYWHVEAAGRRYENLVWSYPAPVREAAPLRDSLCFSSERVDAIEVAPPDGALPDGLPPDGLPPDGLPPRSQ